MIASPPCPGLVSETTAPFYAESPGLPQQDVRRLLHRIGRHVSLLRTVDAAPRPSSLRRTAAGRDVSDQT